MDSYTATTHSSLMGRVKRTFLNFVGYSLKINYSPHNYTPVLKSLGLASLADRRHHANLKSLSKLIYLVILIPLLSFRLYHSKSLLVGQAKHIFHIPSFSTLYGSNKPLVIRCMSLANSNASLSIFIPD